MKKKGILSILAVAMAFTVTACGGEIKQEKASDNASADADRGSFQASDELDSKYADTIYVAGLWGNFEALDQASQDFGEFYPNIEVIYSPLNDVNTDIENRMASGKEIDIYMYNWLNTNDSSKAYLWDNAADLSQIGLDLDILDQNMLQTGYVDGKLKMMPLYRRIYGFMVNEDLLKAHDMKVPKTYEDFLACCEKFKAEGIFPVLYAGDGNLVSTYGQHIIAQTVRSKDCDAIMADALEGKDSFGVIGDTLKLMTDLTDKEYIHPDSSNLEDVYESVILRFFEGDIPFVPYNTELFSGTRKREAKSESFTEHPFTYSFIPFPGEDGYECMYEQLGTMYMGVFDGIEDERKPYVYELFRYLLSDDGNYTLENIKNMPGINKNTGLADFPYLKNLKDDQIFAVGKDGLDLKFSELLTEAAVDYEHGITEEEYLKRSINYISSKKK